MDHAFQLLEADKNKSSLTAIAATIEQSPTPFVQTFAQS
jgi:hypothetical protein